MIKYAVHCKTQEEYDSLMDIYVKKWWKQKDWQQPKSQNNFDRYGELCVLYNDKLEYGSKGFLKLMWYKILTFNELLEMEWLANFKRGDKVLVRDSDSAIRLERIYLATIEWAKQPFHCVEGQDGKEFLDWRPFAVWYRKQIKPLPVETVVTLKEIADKFGVNVENLKINLSR